MLKSCQGSGRTLFGQFGVAGHSYLSGDCGVFYTFRTSLREGYGDLAGSVKKENFFREPSQCFEYSQK